MVIFGPHLSWNFGMSVPKFGDCAAGYSTISPSFTASSTCGVSKNATSNGGLLPLAAVRRATWSVPSTIDCVTAAPVADLKAGEMTLRSASFQVPGNVAATSVFACARATWGIASAAANAAAPPIMVRRLRRKVMAVSLWSGQWKNVAGLGGRRRDPHLLAAPAHRLVAFARLADLQRQRGRHLDLV